LHGQAIGRCWATVFLELLFSLLFLLTIELLIGVDGGGLVRDRSRDGRRRVRVAGGDALEVVINRLSLYKRELGDILFQTP
jgi:hypothetical protein